jgi:uncharacterized protein YecT (DUF1311 family)
MKLAAAVCGLVILLVAGAHASLVGHDAAPQKPLTPEQQEKQRNWQEYMAKRHDLQAQAKQVFDTEMAREKAGECAEAMTTYDINVCFGKELGITDGNLKSFEDVIRELIASVPEAPGASTAVSASSSPGRAQSGAEFERVNQVWEQYRDTACAAAFHQFDGGTGGPSFEAQCRLMLNRDHMRELNVIYGGDLRL